MSELRRGLALCGRVWPGGPAAVLDDAVVVVAGDGRVAAVGPRAAVPLPADLEVRGGPGCWVGPGIVDAHVHLAFGPPAEALRGGVVAVRDLGAPLDRALAWRSAGGAAPSVAVAGPLLTAPGGYPSASWGAAGFALFVPDPAAARTAVARLAAAGVDVVKLALEPAGGRPVPDPDTARAVVEAAHRAGLAAVAHALSAAMVERALDAGVDELVHVPVGRLPPRLVARIAGARIPVVSTLETLARDEPATVTANAAALVAAGVPLLYGSDLGNAGTTTGVDPRELARLAAAGLGPLGALRAATEGSAGAAGVRAGDGTITVGAPARLVLLATDPLADPTAWRRPLAVIAPAG